MMPLPELFEVTALSSLQALDCCTACDSDVQQLCQLDRSVFPANVTCIKVSRWSASSERCWHLSDPIDEACCSALLVCSAIMQS